MKQDPDAHLRMAQKRKAGFDKKKAAATQEKGLLIVHTGTGKGKSSAAFGMGLRIVGHGMRLGVVQFIKGALFSAEREVFSRFDNCDFHTMGEGYTWETQNRDQDVATARRGWEQACKMIKDGGYDMLILDELNVILKYQYLPLEEVLAAFAARPATMHIVVTGRNAPEALIDAADLVSDMRLVKHPYREQGIKAQAGVEF
jgi:cob(I)alamin adenosyltransferase